MTARIQVQASWATQQTTTKRQKRSFTSDRGERAKPNNGKTS